MVTGGSEWVLAVCLVIWAGLWLFVLRIASLSARPGGGSAIAVRPLAVNIALLVLALLYLFLGGGIGIDGNTANVIFNLLLWSGLIWQVLPLTRSVRHLEATEDEP